MNLKKNRIYCLMGFVFAFYAFAENPSDSIGPVEPGNGKATTVKKAVRGGIQGLSDPRKRRAGRKLASGSRAQDKRKAIFLAPHISFEGPLAKVSSGSTLSRGLGFGVGMEANYQSGLVKFAFQPSYRQLSLGRKIDGTGTLKDSTPLEVQQKIKYLGFAGFGGVLLEEGGRIGAFEPAWWIELGTELLFPLGQGLQTSSLIGDSKFNADKLWLVLLGSSTEVQLAQEQLLRTSLHLFYNLGSDSKNRLFGVRAQIAFEFGLM